MPLFNREFLEKICQGIGGVLLLAGSSSYAQVTMGPIDPMDVLNKLLWDFSDRCVSKQAKDGSTIVNMMADRRKALDIAKNNLSRAINSGEMYNGGKSGSGMKR